MYLCYLFYVPSDFFGALNTRRRMYNMLQYFEITWNHLEISQKISSIVKNTAV